MTNRGDGRRERWAEHRRARREQLVDAAIRAVRRHGAGVGMDEIAAEAGTSKPVVYRYFADKTDVYAAVGHRVGGTLLARIRAALGSGEAPEALVRAAVSGYLDLIATDPEIYRFVVRRPQLDRPATQDMVADYATLVAGELAKLIEERMAGAGLDPAPALVWAIGLVGLVRAAGEWWLDAGTISRAELTDQLTALITNGLPAGGSVDVPVGRGHTVDPSR